MKIKHPTPETSCSLPTLFSLEKQRNPLVQSDYLENNTSRSLLADREQMAIGTSELALAPRLSMTVYEYLSIMARYCENPESFWQDCLNELGADIVELYEQQHCTLRVRNIPHRSGNNGINAERYHQALFKVARPEVTLPALRALLERLGHTSERYLLWCFDAQPVP